MVYFQVDLESVVGDLDMNVELTHIVRDANQSFGALSIKIVVDLETLTGDE